MRCKLLNFIVQIAEMSISNHSQAHLVSTEVTNTDTEHCEDSRS